ncbi:hypothetical protein ACFQ08_10730 [Streptosporangium algeriense]|uniref:Uncharacterized protein n=1 Tax=Streptosporangium algeriense TaxID=1682748 RepID=A0ABW3DQR1_9ACTN
MTSAAGVVLGEEGRRRLPARQRPLQHTPQALGRVGVRLDERLRPVDAPAFAYDTDARERLWEVSSDAAGDPSWAW